MPDGWLFLQASLASAAISAALVVAGARVARRVSFVGAEGSALVGLVCGLIVGYAWLGFVWVWPPLNALQRLLQLILPAALLIEAAACWPAVPRRLIVGLRFALAAVTGRVLWQGSVYLDPARGGWSQAWALGTLLGCGGLLIGSWWALGRLLRRPAGTSVVAALGMVLVGGGVATMMAGYLKGGTAALPLAAAVLGSGLALSLVARGRSLDGPLSCGVLGLFGLLFIGRFFGGLGTPAALVLGLAPLLCWVSELSWLRPALKSRAGLIAALRLLLVALVLGAVLFQAKQAFDRDFRPLLRAVPVPPPPVAAALLDRP